MVCSLCLKQAVCVWKCIKLECSTKSSTHIHGSTLREHLVMWGSLSGIRLGILSLCTEPWHGTRNISISWDFCLNRKAIWWIYYVYRYWLWIHIHLSTIFNLTLNCSLILTHARRSDQYCRVQPHELLWQL